MVRTSIVAFEEYASEAQDQDTVAPEPRDVTARAQVLQVLQSLPGIDRELQAPRDPTDQELLAAIFSHQQPFHALRKCGCSLAQAAMVVDLLPLAASAPDLGPRKPRVQRCGVRWQLVAGAGAILGALALLASVGAIVGNATAGWESGTCSLSGFSNSSCSEQQSEFSCLLMVEVRTAGQIRRMYDWHPAVVHSYGGSHNVFAHEAFRCCRIEDCCGFYDLVNQAYCDDWAYRTDEHGRQCPSTGWDCIFKLGEKEHEFGTRGVSELKAYSAPVIWPHLVCAVALAAAGVACLAHERWESLQRQTGGKASSNCSSEGSSPPTSGRRVPAGLALGGGDATAPQARKRSASAGSISIAAAAAATAAAAPLPGETREAANVAKAPAPAPTPAPAAPPGVVEPAEPEGEPPIISKTGDTAGLPSLNYLPPPLESQFPPQNRRTPSPSPVGAAARPASRGSAGGSRPNSRGGGGAGWPSGMSPATPAGGGSRPTSRGNGGGEWRTPAATPVGGGRPDSRGSGGGEWRTQASPLAGSRPVSRGVPGGREGMPTAPPASPSRRMSFDARGAFEDDDFGAPMQLPWCGGRASPARFQHPGARSPAGASASPGRLSPSASPGGRPLRSPAREAVDLA